MSVTSEYLVVWAMTVHAHDEDAAAKRAAAMGAAMDLLAHPALALSGGDASDFNELMNDYPGYYPEEEDEDGERE